MQGRPKQFYTRGSLLSAMMSGQAGVDVRRAARRLHSEGAPAVSVDGEVGEMAQELAASEVSRSLAVMEAAPPLFWIEAERNLETGPPEIRGWLVERKRGELVALGFRVLAAKDAVPEIREVLTVRFGPGGEPDDDATLLVRGLVTAACLPGMMSQMGENAPVVILPAEAPEEDLRALRGFRLSVATCRGSD